MKIIVWQTNSSRASLKKRSELLCYSTICCPLSFPNISVCVPHNNAQHRRVATRNTYTKADALCMKRFSPHTLKLIPSIAVQREEVLNVCLFFLHCTATSRARISSCESKRKANRHVTVNASIWGICRGHQKSVESWELLSRIEGRFIGSLRFRNYEHDLPLEHVNARLTLFSGYSYKLTK